MSEDVKATGVAIVLASGLDLLLYMRDDNPLIPHRLQWALPDGKIEEGEDPLEAAYGCLKRKFNWPRRYVELTPLGVTPKGTAMFFGDMRRYDFPDLKPGEGAALLLSSTLGVNALIAAVGYGDKPGQLVPLVVKHWARITGLVRREIVPYGRPISWL